MENTLRAIITKKVIILKCKGFKELWYVLVICSNYRYWSISDDFIAFLLK